MQPNLSKLVIISFFRIGRLAFLFREHERRVIIPVKGDYGIEVLALLALEAFEQLGVPVSEQVFYFIVGQGASRFQPEHEKPALRVVAAVPPCRRTASCPCRTWTRATGIAAAEEFVA